MNKIHITAEISEDMFDDAAKQILKKKIRELIAQSIDGEIEEVIRHAVHERVDKLRGVCYWNSSYLTEKIEKYVTEQITDDKIAETVRAATIGYMKQYGASLEKFMKEKMDYLRTDTQKAIDKIIMDTLFAQYKKDAKDET